MCVYKTYIHHSNSMNIITILSRQVHNLHESVRKICILINMQPCLGQICIKLCFFLKNHNDDFATCDFSIMQASINHCHPRPNMQELVGYYSF